MGARGPLPKRDETGRRLRNPTNLVLLPIKPAEAPAMPADWLPPTKKAWMAYWNSGLAAHTIDVDLPQIEGYFRAYNMWQRMMALFEDEPFTKGSMGQIRTNPAGDEAHKCRAEMDKLAGPLGMTHKSRKDMGIATGKAAESVEDLNQKSKTRALARKALRRPGPPG